jgi:hypothetical protein
MIPLAGSPFPLAQKYERCNSGRKCGERKKPGSGRAPWLTSVIPASQEAEIGRIAAQSQPGQIVHEILSRKHPSQKRAGGVACGVDLEFKKKKNSVLTGFKSLVWHWVNFLTSLNT